MTDWSGRPAYQQVADGIRTRIRAGGILPGGQLPSHADLMREYAVSITVVRMALSQLRAEGYVITHQGKGAFVREQLPDASSTQAGSADFDKVMTQLQLIHDDLRRVDDRLVRLERLVGPDERPAARQERRSGA